MLPSDGRLVGVLKLPAVHQAEDCGHQFCQGSIAIGSMPMTMALAGKADHQNAVGSRRTHAHDRADERGNRKCRPGNSHLT